MRSFVEDAREVNPTIKLGNFGEHCDELDSGKFCFTPGLIRASCSPKRVPVARLAAAQAALESKIKEERDK